VLHLKSDTLESIIDMELKGDHLSIALTVIFAITAFVIVFFPKKKKIEVKGKEQCSDEFIPDEDHYHEVMDRASMLLEVWEDQVKDLGVTKHDPRLRAAARRVSIVMSDFYQIAGEVHSEKQDEQKTIK